MSSLGIYFDFLDAAYAVDVERENAERVPTNAQKRLTSVFLTETQFRKRYRLSKDLFKKLVEELAPHMKKPQRSDGLDIQTKIKIALTFYATGSYQTPIADNLLHPVCQASVSNAITEVTAALNKIINNYVKFPFTRADRDHIKARFYLASKMPGAIGCIDGTHVSIIKPNQHEERFINRKGYHSLNILIMCDSDLNILCVDSSHPGSTHDSRVWEGNPLSQVIKRLYEENYEDVYVLADSGYPLRTTIMTPILNAAPDSAEAYYTNLHLSARSGVERCIGVLKARFRCLLLDRKLHYSPKNAALIVNACCVLHNIAHGSGIN